LQAQRTFAGQGCRTSGSSPHAGRAFPTLQKPTYCLGLAHGSIGPRAVCRMYAAAWGFKTVRLASHGVVAPTMTASRTCKFPSVEELQIANRDHRHTFRVLCFKLRGRALCHSHFFAAGLGDRVCSGGEGRGSHSCG